MAELEMNGGIVDVPEDSVDHFLSQGWKRVQAKEPPKKAAEPRKLTAKPVDKNGES